MKNLKIGCVILPERIRTISEKRLRVIKDEGIKYCASVCKKKNNELGLCLAQSNIGMKNYQSEIFISAEQRAIEMACIRDDFNNIEKMLYISSLYFPNDDEVVSNCLKNGIDGNQIDLLARKIRKIKVLFPSEQVQNICDSTQDFNDIRKISTLKFDCPSTHILLNKLFMMRELDYKSQQSKIKKY